MERLRWIGEGVLYGLVVCLGAAVIVGWVAIVSHFIIKYW